MRRNFRAWAEEDGTSGSVCHPQASKFLYSFKDLKITPRLLLLFGNGKEERM